MRCDCHAQQPLFRLLDGFVFAPADRREEHHDQRNYRDREEGGANGCIDENHWIATREPQGAPKILFQHRPEYEAKDQRRSEEHTSELQSLMRISYAVFCLKKKTQPKIRLKNKHKQQ